MENLRKSAKEANKFNAIVDDLTDNLEETIESFNDEGIEVGDIVKMGDLETGHLAEQLTDMYN